MTVIPPTREVLDVNEIVGDFELPCDSHKWIGKSAVATHAIIPGPQMCGCVQLICDQCHRHLTLSILRSAKLFCLRHGLLGPATAVITGFTPL